MHYNPLTGTRLALSTAGIAWILTLLACHDTAKPVASSNGGSANLAGAAGQSAVSAGAGGDAAAAGAAGNTASGNAGGNAGTSGAAGAAAGGTAPVTGCAPPIELEGFVEVSPNDPNIRYVGRVVTKPGSVSFAYPAVQIQTIFEGDAIDLRLRDNTLNIPVATNLYWVIIDGEAKKFEPCQSSEVYPLARNLGPGKHTLTIVKRTESSLGGHGNAGKGEVLGFRVRTGTSLSAVAPPARRMEFVGDSITCGYGDEISTTDPDSYKFTSINEDAWHAYGAVTARALEADYVAVAASGYGVIRNYGGFVAPVVPKLYERTLPDDSGAPLWDHSRYAPDVIVVNLGTNDFSPGIALDQLDAHRAAFRAGYVDFLTHLRDLHATATIVAVVGPMMNDDFPVGYSAWTSIQADVTAAVETRRAANDSSVYYFALAPQEGPWGEDWHPTLATHQKMADALVPFIANLKGW